MARGLALVAVLAVLQTSSAAACGLAIERYEYARPPEVAPVIRKLNRFLLARGVTIDGELLWDDFRRLPAVVDEELTVRKLADALEAAYKEWWRGNFKKADPLLDTVVQQVRDNPGIATEVDALPELLTKVYVARAMRRLDNGDKNGAIESMMQLITDIPEHPAVRSQFGPEAEKQYNEALKRQRVVKRGKFVVRVSNPLARIFINEIERGKDGVFKGELPVGDYRIFVRVGAKGYRFDSHVYDGTANTVEINWDHQLALVTTREWVGMIIRPDQKDRELEFMSETSRYLGTEVAVIGFRKTAKHRYLTGEVYNDAYKRFVRDGEIVLDDDQMDERMAAFAQFLCDGEPSPLVTLGIGASDEDRRPRSVSRGGEPPASTYIAWLAGGAMLVAGVSLIAADYENPQECADPPCKGRYGWPLAGVGLGVFALGFVFDIRAHRAVASVVPSGSGAMASVGWSF